MGHMSIMRLAAEEWRVTKVDAHEDESGLADTFEDPQECPDDNEASEVVACGGTS